MTIRFLLFVPVCTQNPLSTGWAGTITTLSIQFEGLLSPVFGKFSAYCPGPGRCNHSSNLSHSAYLTIWPSIRGPPKYYLLASRPANVHSTQDFPLTLLDGWEEKVAGGKKSEGGSDLYPTHPLRIVGHFRDSLRYSSERDVGTLAPHDEFLSMDERGTAHDRRPFYIGGRRTIRSHSSSIKRKADRGAGRVGRCRSLHSVRSFLWA